MQRLFPILLILLAACPSTLAAEPDEPDAKGIAFFEKHIRPLLVDKCYQCHSADTSITKKPKGGLRLDTRDAALLGGDSGPSLVPGKVDESLIIKAVRYTDSDLRMPPKTKLTDAEIRLLEEWVKMGAPDPRDGEAAPVAKATTIDLDQGRKHWAFQAVRDSLPPQVRDQAWSASPIDHFILAKLEEAGVASPRLADKRTLIRRATFDLIGLPPTPAQIEAFLADDSADAFAKVIDRLLASPRYGERWGRHWLDVARYADSNGLDENVAHGNAWRYRDYVIASFNDDKPFDQFITQQIAGDLLSTQSPPTPVGGSAKPQAAYEPLIATAFLSLGPKVLAEVDKTKMEMDIIDEQIDTTGRAFLAMTIGCARCHDHKFDPISTRDYYALAGIFKSTKTMESFVTIAKWWENATPSAEDLKRKGEHDAKLAATKATIAARVEKANADLLAKLNAAVKPNETETPADVNAASKSPAIAVKLPEKPETQYDDAAKADLKKLRDELTATEKAAPVMSAAMGVTEGKPVDVAVHIRGSHLSLGDVVPRRFPLVLTTATQEPIAKNHSGRLELAKWITSKDNPLTARVIVNRVWHWHFGRGLVRTPDNFGKLGETPTHPALLDWLASRFVEEGWSIKALHRRIMLSSTYRMSSEHDAKVTQLDPENRLYSRAPIRRLEAEAIRDAMLFVSGRLDTTMGGPAITHVKNREFLFDHTSKDGTTYDNTRRSVYQPVVRNHLYDFFELFDFPDSAVSQGDRPTTTVAPQALLAMNSPLIWESAGKLAKKFEDGKLKEFVNELYMAALGRPATGEEVTRIAALMESATNANDRLLQRICQAILVSNEFMYIR
ncbi:MAG: PSD1 and planctomycete cytochrome C domain-containing protein [Phycisphaeraceae bacterium]